MSRYCRTTLERPWSWTRPELLFDGVTQVDDGKDTLHRLLEDITPDIPCRAVPTDANTVHTTGLHNAEDIVNIALKSLLN